MMCICLYVYVYMLCDKRHISQMLHGAGIFTYIEAPKMNQMKVNIPYMEHLGIQTWCVWCLYIYIYTYLLCVTRDIDIHDMYMSKYMLYVQEKRMYGIWDYITMCVRGGLWLTPVASMISTSKRPSWHCWLNPLSLLVIINQNKQWGMPKLQPIGNLLSW